MSYLSASDLLKPLETEYRDVQIPELNGKVRIRSMTAREKSQFERSFQSAKGKPLESRKAEIRERMIVAACVDESGNPLFTAENVEQLGRQNVRVIDRIVAEIHDLWGSTDEDVEDLAKNSDETETSD